MNFLRKGLCWVLVCAPLVYGADSGSPANDAANSLKGKVVFLRGMEAGDKLSFDAQGAEVKPEAPGAFAYSAVQIDKVHLSETELEIKGDRVALIFATDSEPPSLKTLHSIPLSEPVKITIALNPARPEGLSDAIQKDFAFSLHDALSGMSAEELKKAIDTIGSFALSTDVAASQKHTTVGTHTGNTGVTPPQVIYSVAPVFPDSTRQEKTGGTCIISMFVDTNGRPVHIRVFHTTDFDLDFAAVTAVTQCRFKPAIYQGKPVVVFVNVEVNFRF